MKKYTDVIELRTAIEERFIIRETLECFTSGGELYIQNESGFTVFEGDYCSEKGCRDVARLLGFDDVSVQ